MLRQTKVSYFSIYFYFYISYQNRRMDFVHEKSENYPLHYLCRITSEADDASYIGLLTSVIDCHPNASKEAVKDNWLPLSIICRNASNIKPIILILNANRKAVTSCTADG